MVTIWMYHKKLCTSVHFNYVNILCCFGDLKHSTKWDNHSICIRHPVRADFIIILPRPLVWEKWVSRLPHSTDCLTTGSVIITKYQCVQTLTRQIDRHVLTLSTTAYLSWVDLLHEKCSAEQCLRTVRLTYREFFFHRFFLVSISRGWLLPSDTCCRLLHSSLHNNDIQLGT